MNHLWLPCCLRCCFCFLLSLPRIARFVHWMKGREQGREQWEQGWDLSRCMLLLCTTTHCNSVQLDSNRIALYLRCCCIVCVGRANSESLTLSPPSSLTLSHTTHRKTFHHLQIPLCSSILLYSYPLNDAMSTLWRLQRATIDHCHIHMYICTYVCYVCVCLAVCRETLAVLDWSGAMRCFSFPVTTDPLCLFLITNPFGFLSIDSFRFDRWVRAPLPASSMRRRWWVLLVSRSSAGVSVCVIDKNNASWRVCFDHTREDSLFPTLCGFFTERSDTAEQEGGKRKGMTLHCIAFLFLSRLVVCAVSLRCEGIRFELRGIEQAEEKGWKNPKVDCRERSWKIICLMEKQCF